MANTKEIPKNEWREFLDDFTRENQGLRVQIEVQDPEIGSQVEARDLPLQGIAADNKEVAVIVGDEMDPALTHIVHGATRLWVQYGSGGKVLALEIEGGDGSKTLVRFVQALRAA
jgi:hypothetical protein